MVNQWGVRLPNSDQSNTLVITTPNRIQHVSRDTVKVSLQSSFLIFLPGNLSIFILYLLSQKQMIFSSTVDKVIFSSNSIRKPRIFSSILIGNPQSFLQLYDFCLIFSSILRPPIFNLQWNTRGAPSIFLEAMCKENKLLLCSGHVDDHGHVWFWPVWK